jgi:hypothetical protein
MIISSDEKQAFKISLASSGESPDTRSNKQKALRANPSQRAFDRLKGLDRKQYEEGDSLKGKDQMDGRNWRRIEGAEAHIFSNYRRGAGQ